MGCASSSLASRLREACDENNIEEVRRLLVQENAVSVINAADEHGATALHFATGWKAVNKKWDKYDALKKEKAELAAYKDAMRITLLAFSRFPDTTALVQLLLEHGAEVEQQTGDQAMTPLMCAAHIGQPSVIKAFLSAGADIYAVDSSGRQALHLAADYGHPIVLSILLEAGSDVLASAYDGSTALLYASRQGHTEVVSLLLDAGADIDVRNSGGCSAFHLAACNEEVEVVSLLLAAGAATETREFEGTTALHNAALHNAVDIVSLLIDAGANLEARDNDVSTALIIAANRGNAEVVRLLLEALPSKGLTARDCAEHCRLLRLLYTIIFHKFFLNFVFPIVFLPNI